MVTCNRRLENPAGLRLSPSLPLFFCFWNFSDANAGRGISQPLYKGGRAGRPAAGRPRPATPLPGDLGGRPPRCRATGPQGPARNFLSEFFFSEMPLPPRCRAAWSRPPASGAAGVYSCKFPNRKYIFVKNRNKKYKNKKPPARSLFYLGRTGPFMQTAAFFYFLYFPKLFFYRNIFSVS